MGRRHGDVPWTEPEIALAARMFADGMTPKEIALTREFVGRRDKDAIRNRLLKAGFTAMGLRKGEIPHSATVQAKGYITTLLDVPPRPFAVTFPKVADARGGKPLRAIVYGDTHYPFQDDRVLQVVKAVVKDLKPDIIVNVGDLVDCWQISRFEKDPTRKDSLQDNIDQAREHLHEMAQLAPKAQRVYLEGNHESRLRRLICGLEGADRELAKLRNFQKHLTWPALLDLDAVGWRFIPERDQSKTAVLPKIITKHGTVVRKWSGATARGEWEKYGASGVSGHTHRLGHFFHRDHNGTARWIETGCTCLLDPPYGTDYDWQQGFAVLSWNADRRLMHEDVVGIREGAALWRDKEYHG